MRENIVLMTNLNSLEALSQAKGLGLVCREDPHVSRRAGRCVLFASTAQMPLIQQWWVSGGVRYTRPA